MKRRLPSVIAVLSSLLLLSMEPSFADEPGTLNFTRYMDGKYVFERNCMICHGARGDGAGEMAASLQQRPRSFREGMFKFRTTPFGALPTDDDLRHTIKGGLSGTAMGMFVHHSDEDVSAVIEYVKSFSCKKENYAAPMQLPNPPGWLQDDKQKADHAVAGKALFQTHCAACHGTSADGRGPAAPALKDIWNLPATPSDLRQPHLRCGDRPQDIYRVLATRLNGTPMVSFDATFSPDQRWDIIAWIFTRKLPATPTLGAAPPRSAGEVPFPKSMTK